MKQYSVKKHEQILLSVFSFVCAFPSNTCARRNGIPNRMELDTRSRLTRYDRPVVWCMFMALGFPISFGFPLTKQTSESLRRLSSCPAIFSYRQGTRKRGIPWTGIQLLERTHLLYMAIIWDAPIFHDGGDDDDDDTKGTICQNKCTNPTGCGMQLRHLALE